MLAPVRTAAPTGEIVTLEEIKRHVLVEHDEDDELLKAYIAAAVDHLDGYSGILGQALLEQTWRQDFAGFGDCMRLPLGPARSVVSIEYFDSSNTKKTLDESVFQILTDARGPFVSLQGGKNWPSTFDRQDSVSVSYTAGFGDAASVVPAAIRHAIMMMVATWYASRRSVVVGQTAVELPHGASMLIAPYRRIGV